jgi:hypothetical protein
MWGRGLAKNTYTVVYKNFFELPNPRSVNVRQCALALPFISQY